MGAGILLTIGIFCVLLPCIAATYSEQGSRDECNSKENRKEHSDWSNSNNDNAN